MTRSACLAAASALALATVLSISIAGAQNVDDAGQRAPRIAPVGPVLGQSGGLRLPLLSAVQNVLVGETGAADASTASQLSAGLKLAKVEVEGDAKAPKLGAGPASEPKPPVEAKANDAPVVVKDVAKNAGLQGPAEAKPDKPAEPPRAPAEKQPVAEAKPVEPTRIPAEKQPTAEAKVEQQAAPARAKEARAEAAPVDSAPSVNRGQVAVQPAQQQAPAGPGFTSRQPRNFGYGGYGYAGHGYGGHGYSGYGRHPTYNQQCEH